MDEILLFLVDNFRLIISGWLILAVGWQIRFECVHPEGGWTAQDHSLRSYRVGYIAWLYRQTGEDVRGRALLNIAKYNLKLSCEIVFLCAAVWAYAVYDPSFINLKGYASWIHLGALLASPIAAFWWLPRSVHRSLGWLGQMEARLKGDMVDAKWAHIQSLDLQDATPAASIAPNKRRL